MKEVQAIQSFIHGENRRRGDRFSVSDHVAEELARNGLVRVLTEGRDPANPTGGAGTPSSASPVAQVSPQTTANVSANGVKRRGRPRKASS